MGRAQARLLDAVLQLVNPVLVLAIPSAVAACYLAWNRSRDPALRTRRLLKKTRVTPIAQLTDGVLACVVGTVETTEPLLTSMITKQPCVAYETHVYFFTASSYVPERVEVERRMIPFFVRDASGVVRIDAPEAALSSQPVANSDRYIERLIPAGSTIRLVGSVHLEPARDHGFRERGFRDATSLKPTITGTAKFPLLIDIERRWGR